MNFKEFVTGKDDENRRLDKVLRIILPEMSLPEIYKTLRKGLIRVNDKKNKPEYRIIAGDKISIADFLLENNRNDDKKSSTDESKSNQLELQVIFQNQHILIINKPYNQNVHGDENSLDKKIQDYYKNLNNSDSLSFKPGPLHRLDKKTTGLLAFSLSLEGARWFSENIQNHTIQKKYLGIVEGDLQNQESWIDEIANEHENNNGFFTVKASDQKINNSKKAETTVYPIAKGIIENQPVTLVEFFIKTGRKHQIRSQSSLHNHPLAGDKAYGSSIILKNINRDFFLHAYKLEIPENPVGLPSLLKCPPDSDFIEFLSYCRIKKTGL